MRSAAIQWRARSGARSVNAMNPWLKVALGAVLAAVIVRYAGRGTVFNSLMNREKPKDVPVVHPQSDAQFDSQVAPGAPL